MDNREVLKALRKGWWLLALGMVLGALTALLISFLTVPIYTSSTQLFVSTNDSTSTSAVFQGGQFSQQRVASYAQLVTGDELLGRVIDDLDLDVTPEELAEQVTATALSETVLLEIIVDDKDPERARTIARSAAVQFSGMVSELETPDGGESSPVKVTVVDAAEAATVPSSPRPVRNIALGIVTGLLVGGVVATSRVALDRTLRDPDAAAEVADAPVIGTILRDDKLGSAHILMRNSTSRTAEDFRQLRTNLQFLSVDKPPKLIMVSSALPREGKTTLTVNLALSLAESGRRVTVVEADLRRPRVTQYLGLVGGVGLTNILSDSASLEEVVQTYGDGGFAVLASGPTPPNPSQLLASSHMAQLLDKLRAENDFVLIDAPPLLPVADAAGLAVFVDGVLLSTRYGVTRRDQLGQASAMLQRVQSTVLGVVLNIVPPSAEIATAIGYDYETRPPRSGRHR